MVSSKKGEVKKLGLQAFRHSESGQREMFWHLVPYFLQLSDGWELTINQSIHIRKTLDDNNSET